MRKPKRAPPAPPAAEDRVPLALAALLALAAGAAQVFVTRGFQQVPSPLFGGDYSYQLGCVRSILASGNPMASCSCSGAMPGYLPLYGTIAALIARLGGQDPVAAMAALSALAHAVSSFAVFLVVRRHFGAGAGLGIACLWTLRYVDPVFKYTEFTAQVLVPFAYDALLLTLRSWRKRHAAYLGGMLALLGYAHAVAFVAMIAVSGLSLAIAAVYRARDAGAQAFRDAAAALGVAAAGAALAIGYWWRPLFVHRGRTSLHYAEWNGGASVRTLGERLAQAGEFVASWFRFHDATAALLSVLFLAGLLALLFPAARRRHGATLVVAAATAAWVLHPFVTMPLLGTHFVPIYVRSMLWAFAAPLVAAVALAAGFARLGSAVARGAQVAMLVATLAALALAARGLDARPDVTRAREPLPAAYAELQRWALAHTAPDDVALSANELSFAWSALTGRKTLVTRRAQNDAFLDMDERNRDAALILYGNDGARRRALLERWSVDWVLWTADWNPSEFSVDGSGGVHPVDPLMVFYSAEREAELRAAGIRTSTVVGFVDPSLNDPRIPQFRMTFVLPHNYQPGPRPWRDDLGACLEAVWAHVEAGDTVAALYRVRCAPTIADGVQGAEALRRDDRASLHPAVLSQP